jgi:hypothetical protein
MFTSCALSRKLPNGTSDFIQAHITGYEIWSDVAFWEEYFWGTQAMTFAALTCRMQTRSARSTRLSSEMPTLLPMRRLKSQR